MEARQIKLKTDFKSQEADLQEEQRLKAIKKILVGNQLDGLESRFAGLSERVDESNELMLASMQELKNQLNDLRKQMLNKSEPSPSHSVSDHKKQAGGSFSELQKALEKLSHRAKETKLASSPTMSELEKSLNPINRMESEYRKETAKPELSERYSLQDFNDKLNTKVDLEGQKNMIEQRLRDLEAKINRVSPEAIESVERRVNDRQDRFENETQDLLERLASRVNERFDFAQNERDALEHRVSAIQDILENDILNYLKKGGGSVQGYNVERVKAEMEQKMRENTIRMEAKLEALMDLNQRQMRSSYEDPKKKALRETLEKLSKLLDE